jgi:hypothetical protein
MMTILMKGGNEGIGIPERSEDMPRKFIDGFPSI